MKINKEILKASTEWGTKVIYELEFEVRCPYCKSMIYNYELKKDDGLEISEIIKCPHCKKKIDLFVEKHELL